MLCRETSVCLIIVLGGLASRALAEELPNPFAEIANFTRTRDSSDPRSLEEMMQEARRLTLYGAERRYARQLLTVNADHVGARKLLHYQRFEDKKSGKNVWLDWFDAWMWKVKGLVRHREYGYCRPQDRALMDGGQLRRSSGQVVAVDTWDKQHATWSTAHVVLSRHFEIKSTIPLAAIWYVADDLDKLVLAYLDYFEIEQLPPTRFPVHLYRTAPDATAAGADAELLKKYGAYYYPADRTLHVKFDSVGGLTAVRHEAAHALNRQFADANPHQWFDEGVGVFCQFVIPTDDGSFEFGRYPTNHGFGTVFLKQVRDGKRERMIDIHAEKHVIPTSHYYSKWRAMIDFYMNADEQKYRLTFLRALFRRQGDVQRLLTMPEIDTAWTEYMLSLSPDPNWRYSPLPSERTELIKTLLKRHAAAVAQ